MKRTVVITGSAGLIGSEAARFYCERGHRVVGIDNDMRQQFFGAEASTRANRAELQRDYRNYFHYDVDVRNQTAIDEIFREHGSDLDLVIHAAGQPSHDWAARDPCTDFAVNAAATLLLLDATRRTAPDAAFVFTSTNKVYGDRPNRLPLVEQPTRWEIDPSHRFRNGIDESMSVDATMHSIFGVSKLAADVLVQEYGRYFGLKTACFRCGCVTGPHHAGATLHGFLSYLIKCLVCRVPYVVFGYQGKQVRDNIHSADLVQAIDQFYRSPRSGAVYNIGGGRRSNCSVIEAIASCEELLGERLTVQYVDVPRPGDHLWWISDTRKFSEHYPEWQPQFDLPAIIDQIAQSHARRWVTDGRRHHVA